MLMRLVQEAALKGRLVAFETLFPLIGRYMNAALRLYRSAFLKRTRSGRKLSFSSDPKISHPFFQFLIV